MKLDFVKIFQSKQFKIIFIGVVGVIMLLLIFKIGMMVGFKQADFSYRWGDNYHTNFAGPQGGFLLRDFNGREFMDAHGVFGQIIKIDNPMIITRGPGDMEKIVLVKNNTIINRLRDRIEIDDLRPDDFIVVIGAPNNIGQIEARLIRMVLSPSFR
ncbi:MAG: hypothetical protein PHV78_02920 [Patescibacteria group bacterium]|nr:hypothetical protein [Patescibacteria group bacterium]MDD5121663.1 hypothetical protein [Patescibacteria group bacterium]MDD5222278.1 hypothetical protein [Patescibacteria group bacterium]MDD5396173.1 hypothetical protein [Patescibacteria group bacterium]